MNTGISELSDQEVGAVSGAGVMYLLGYAFGYSVVEASTFYSELPAGVALL